MKQDALWETWCQFKFGTIAPELTKSERGRINRALKELREIHATEQGMKSRIAEYQRRWPKIECSITALAANWSALSTKSATVETDEDRALKKQREALEFELRNAVIEQHRFGLNPRTADETASDFVQRIKKQASIEMTARIR